ncbi:MAG: Rieske 2Fe-2S domain-containing protein [Alphaproteobacteria bacterium]|nr:Rieske 2Fe-2S domain-containing protein [Alphaproteobacteria bacterium]
MSAPACAGKRNPHNAVAAQTPDREGMRDMDGTAPSQLRALVTPERVHRSVYTDPALFELEMARIWGRAWIYVGHESQVKSPGDFFSTRIGRQPVVMVRHSDGSVRVLYNRCGHRGAMVVAEESGHADAFTCCYHGWRYDTDGRLLSVPLPDGYGDGFDLSDPALGMVPVARAASYRGFVFASLAADGPDLKAFLGHMATSLDDLVDRAPDGAIALDAGMHRYVYRGNWKLQVENVLDSYHVPFSHASTVNRKGEQFSRREGDRTGAKVVAQKKTSDAWKGRRSYVTGPGHGWTSNTALDDGKRSSPSFDAYRKTLADKVGAARADEILTPQYHNSMIYPNISIMGLNMHVRVIKPLAVDLTEVTIYPVRLLGAPDEFNSRNIRLLNVTHSAASFVQTDDLEAFRRAQEGLQSQQSDWVDISRGLGEERPDTKYNAVGELATHEMAVRAQYQAWAEYMGRTG